jgi:hypothetical protein
MILGKKEVPVVSRTASTATKMYGDKKKDDPNRMTVLVATGCVTTAAAHMTQREVAATRVGSQNDDNQNDPLTLPQLVCFKVLGDGISPSARTARLEQCSSTN